MSKRKSARKSVDCLACQRSRQLSFEPLENRVLLAVFNVPADMGLPTAIATADSNSDLANTIDVAPGSYELSNCLISTAHVNVGGTVYQQTLSIVGQGQGVILQSDGSNRVLELSGNVVLQNLAIEGGKVQASIGTSAKGGGVLIDGGNATFINVDVSNNSARAPTGRRAPGRGAAKPPAPTAAMEATPTAAGST